MQGAIRAQKWMLWGGRPAPLTSIEEALRAPLFQRNKKDEDVGHAAQTRDR